MTPPTSTTDTAEQPKRFQPPMSEAAAPYWEATRSQRLDVQWCVACEAPIHFPREACPRCLGTDLVFRPASGLGTVYAVSVMPKPGNPGMAGRAPYAVALIDLDEGVRMMSNVFADDPWSVAIGDRVAVAWEALEDGRHLPVFAPVLP
jgi:uncharacterized OB-fold protein